MNVSYPPLRIHVWGGLGSQLFAAALAYDFRSKFPRRKLIIVFHTGGVTKRKPEMVQLFPDFLHEIVDDFSGKPTTSSSSVRVSALRKLNKLIKSIGFAFGFVAEENSRNSKPAFPWTLSVRGHYSHRKLDPNFLHDLARRLDLNSKSDDSDLPFCAILHYRLGDLLSLDEKKPIPADRIVSALARFHEVHEISVLSDSPTTALAKLEQVSTGITFRSINATTNNAIKIGVNADLFFGTSSKISYWIILLRVFLTENRLSYLPIEDLENLKIHIENPTSLRAY